MTTAPTASLPLDDLGDGLGRAATVLRANAGTAGLGAHVPTCPGWTVLDLVAHTGMVHRWAASHLRGTPLTDTAAVEREAREQQDVLGWFDTGATRLLQAVVDAPDDLDALVFLAGAPPARLFWTRRQCHETTIHAVDAMAARLGRPPAVEETWIRPELALDGIDELLRGFVPRRRQAIWPERPTTLLVRPSGTAYAWLVDAAPDAPATTTVVPNEPEGDERAGGEPVSADLVLAGSAVELYLRLWNRGPVPEDGSPDAWWRRHVRVTWG